MGVNYPLSIQWHITTRCQNRCRHCYMFEPATYAREQSRTLNLAQKLAVLDQLDAFGEKWGFEFKSVLLMGGDPLLAEDVFPFIAALRKRGREVSLGGNPESLTDEACARLADLGVDSFQLSLDGLEATHDATRSPGSFARTVEGYARLERHGIAGHTMATLTPLNVDEFFELLDFVCLNTRSKGFAFDFVSAVGNGAGLDACFTPGQVLALCERYLDIKKDYAARGTECRLYEKPGVFRLLHIARDEAAPDYSSETAFQAGCLIGGNCLPILSDGSIMLCRRFPEVTGRLPEDDFEHIFLASDAYKRYRRPQFWPDCGRCVGWNICRGCPAVSYGEHGDPFRKNALCFAELLSFDAHCEHEPIPMDTTMAEEAALIKTQTDYVYCKDVLERRVNRAIPRTVLRLLRDETARAAFIADPRGWLDANQTDMSPSDKAMTIFRYNNTVFH